MKKLKKIVTLLTLAAVCLTAPAFGKITVKAAEPNTYVLNFSPSEGEWRFKPASSWSEEVQDRELYPQGRREISRRTDSRPPIGNLSDQ